MITWWFNGNVDGFMTHPVDGRNYSRCEFPLPAEL
jgi:hypothetical protein